MGGLTLKRAPTRLCSLDDLVDGAARGFEIAAGRGMRRVFLVRRAEAVFAYRDACPHMGVPLPWSGDAYLTRDGRFIRCAQHGALFRVEDGLCVAGPCGGERLTPVAAEIRDREVWVKA